MSHPPNLPNGFTTEVAPWRTDIALSKLTRVTAVVGAQHGRAPFGPLRRVTNAFFRRPYRSARPNLGQGRRSPVCWIRELLASAFVLYGEVFMPSLPGNFRYALRQFRLSPVFTAAAVLTLALGIGGTTAIFTLIHAVMLRSLPVTDPGRLYRVGEGDDCCVEGGPQDDWGFFSFPLYERLKSQAPEFEEAAAFQAGNWPQSVHRQGEPAARPLRSEYVTGNYFSMLGIGAFGGRVFTPEDDKPGAPPV